MSGRLFGTLATGEEYNARYGRGHIAAKTANSGFRYFLNAGLARAFLSSHDHIRFEQHAVEHDPMCIQFGEYFLEHLGSYCLAPADIMISIHEHLRFHDWHQIPFLTKRSVTSQVVSIRANRVRRRQIVLVNFYHCPPFCESCPELFIFRQPIAQSIQPLCDFLSGVQRERLCALIDFYTGYDPTAREKSRERSAVTGALAQGFVKQDHPTDIVFNAFGGEKQFTVSSAVFLG